jgi:hypothetical protein
MFLVYVRQNDTNVRHFLFVENNSNNDKNIQTSTIYSIPKKVESKSYYIIRGKRKIVQFPPKKRAGVIMVLHESIIADAEAYFK